MAATLLLDRDNWDLCVDARGNIAVATEPYAREQDVASECRLMQGEAWYNTGIGIPYLTAVLGRPVPLLLIKERLAAAARRVPGVSNVVVYLTDVSARGVRGQIQFDGGATTL